ncbi:hypothetical protein ABRP60_02640 [Pectobacterium brasiliense]|uniref:hypothetical protein n=1 Tax=Pectobacterium brasiliense TaxID=180957 RepID=UPI001F3F8FD9|nr:hypothetical protein [Pectobacterium brasiliense]
MSLVFPFLLMSNTSVLKKNMLIFLLLSSYLLISSLFNQFWDFKLILSIVFILLILTKLSGVKGYLTLSFSAALYFIFIVSILEKIFPFSFWYLLAENDAHLEMYKSGYAVYSTLGNSTHSAYITLLIGSYLLYVKKHMRYFFITLILLFLFSNKVCLGVFLTLYSCYLLFNSKLKYKVFIAFFLIVVFYIVWLFVFEKYYISWTSTDVENIHTISHRVGLFEFTLQKVGSVDFWLFGDPDFINNFGQAFDSGMILLMFRYGILITFIFYLLMYLAIEREYRMIYWTMVLPSVTQVSFYNSQFIVLCSFVILSLSRNNLQGRKISNMGF